MKTQKCSKCSYVDSPEHFGGRKYCLRCLEAERARAEYKAEWYRQNSPRLKDKGKKYREENPDAGRDWVARNKDRVAANRRAWIAKQSCPEAYGIGYLEMARANGAYERMLAEQGRICPLCHCAITADDETGKYRLAVDHILPLSRGGDEMDENNWQLVHFSCNSRKSAATMDEFLAREGRLF